MTGRFRGTVRTLRSFCRKLNEDMKPILLEPGLSTGPLYQVLPEDFNDLPLLLRWAAEGKLYASERPAERTGRTIPEEIGEPMGESSAGASGNSKVPTEESSTGISGNAKEAAGESSAGISGNAKEPTEESSTGISGNSKEAAGESSDRISGNSKEAAGESSTGISGNSKEAAGESSTGASGNSKEAAGESSTGISESGKVTKHQRIAAILEYVSRSFAFARPEWTDVLPRFWRGVASREAWQDELFLQCGKHKGAVNRYRLMTVMNWLAERQVFREEVTLLQLHLAIEGRARPTTVYRNYSNYPLSHARKELDRILRLASVREETDRNECFRKTVLLS